MGRLGFQTLTAPKPPPLEHIWGSRRSGRGRLAKQALGRGGRTRQTAAEEPLEPGHRDLRRNPSLPDPHRARGRSPALGQSRASRWCPAAPARAEAKAVRAHDAQRSSALGRLCPRRGRLCQRPRADEASADEPPWSAWPRARGSIRQRPGLRGQVSDRLRPPVGPALSATMSRQGLTQSPPGLSAAHRVPVAGLCALVVAGS
jgi:hypothetical protein